MIDMAQFEKEGFVITAPLFSSEEVQQLTTLLEEQKQNDEGPRRGGLRDVLDNLPALRGTSNHTAIRAIVDQVHGKDAFAVRATLFDRMVTVRIHLDACPASNGALRVMPGTHLLGKVNQNHVDKHVDEASAIYCEAGAGEALVMRPLLLHASSAAEHPGHRRVLHFDYAIGDLAAGLEWRMQAQVGTEFSKSLQLS